MAQSFFQGGSSSNYTIGGTRAWFNRAIDLTVTPKRFEGFIDLGNVVEAPQEAEKEEVEHFTAKTGTRKRDRKVNRDISEDIVLTLDEPDEENLRLFFRGDAVTDKTGGVGAGAVVDEVVKGSREDTRILKNGFNATAIVVKDITGVTTFVLDTDYKEIAIIGSYVGIARIAAGSIGDGDLLRVNYTFDTRAHREFAPQTQLDVEGQLLFFGVSDTGNEFIRQIEKVQIEPEGSFDFDDEDFTEFQLRVAILDDTDNAPNFPFGIFQFFGTGTDL